MTTSSEEFWKGNAWKMEWAAEPAASRTRTPASIRAEKNQIEGGRIRWQVARYGYALCDGERGLLGFRWPSGSTKVSFKELAARGEATEWDMRKWTRRALDKLEAEARLVESTPAGPFREARRNLRRDIANSPVNGEPWHAFAEILTENLLTTAK